MTDHNCLILRFELEFWRKMVPGAGKTLKIIKKKRTYFIFAKNVVK
jgi:hypothetical protein